MSARPVLLLAGGTGGHVFPALAVAANLRTRSVPVHWLGGAAGLEAKLVPAAGIDFSSLPGRGVRQSGLGRKLLGAPRLAAAILKAWRLVRRLDPRAAIGFGGYASGAGGLAAWLARCPLVVHEQNAVAGLTNRVLAHLAARVMTGFPGTLGARGEWSGNPVREAFLRVPPPGERYGARSGPLRVLVVGGSQGANVLNHIVPEGLSACTTRFEVHHLCGPDHVATTEASYRASGVRARVEGFSDDMVSLCAWADIAIARAGALTLAEFAAVGLAAVLVPYPAAVDDHQTANACAMVEAEAARLIPQSRLSPASLAAVLEEFARKGRGALAAMAEQARGLARTDAAERIADAALALAREDE